MKILKLLLVGLMSVALSLPTAALAADEEPADTTALDRNLDLYWAKKREMKVIQKRLFLKESRHEFSLFSGVIPNDEFYSYYPIGGRYAYYFQEDFAAELFGSYLVTVDTDLQNFLQENTLDQLFVQIPQTLNWLAGASVLWSPIHGKFGIFTTKLVHFDVYLAFGAGVIATTVINGETREEEATFDPSGNVGLGVRFVFNDLVAMRFDYRQYLYPASTGGVAYPAELTLGVSFFTAAPE